ncbi:hypothetical protein BCT30_17575 [Enterovibrio norvegicus]|uniref:restriction endonuclease subunit S n=1 Tax=Enterovibrio norvegicus TaxID=188144 RepID=UPI000C8678EE|nr:restriction endonuclease subunit S [Enterovibrio norvegicus]MCC4796722.1 restriction endonuclease subunit S [Enterovibrio norvegicus]PMI37307.1 hypothetical protein BCU46_11740 [Enterovibrio norvegicus]PMN49897.1 hypothetical protein BCT30_17575 [Enterovibrio norvegicus]
MSNSVPEGWRVEKLVDCGIGGISNGVFCDPKKVGSGYKLINVYEMYQGYGIDVNLTRRLQLDKKEFEKNKVNFGDVFFTRSSLKLEGIAYCNINLSNDDDITYDGHLMRIVPDRKAVIPEYLARFCLSDDARKYFMSSAKHSTMTTIAQADIAPLPVLLPPLPEQQKIAKILTSVDDVIEKTQAQIDKLKDLKTGMMQELLTRGVGVDGKPHTEFKDSPVGRIPVGWECVQLESLLHQRKNSMRSGPFGSALLKHELVPTGYPYLGIDNVHVEHFETSYKRFVSDEKFEQLKKYAVYEDDVMITIMGTVGRSCVVPHGLGRALSSKHVWTMTFDQTKYLPSLICWQLNYSDWVKKQFRNESQGGVMDSISSKTLKELWMPVPSLGEQQHFHKIHEALTSQIQAKELALKKKRNLKKALMQDLLTGKVRVKVDSQP